MIVQSSWRNLFVFALPMLFALGAGGQSTGDASVEVAVIKQHPATVPHNNFSFAKNRFDLEDQPLLKLIAFAYALNPRQIDGAPGWISEDHWDLRGKTNLSEDATVPQEQQLIRQLLEDRFGLKFHREKRKMSAYALQVVRNKPKLAPAADGAAQPLEWTSGREAERTENFRSNSIADFIVFKQLFMDRPIVDRTGLPGRYDFKLTYSYGDAPSPDLDAAPPMFTAIKEQLGLNFEPLKTEVEVMVIDAIVKPTEN